MRRIALSAAVATALTIALAAQALQRAQAWAGLAGQTYHLDFAADYETESSGHIRLDADLDYDSDTRKIGSWTWTTCHSSWTWTPANCSRRRART